MTTWIPTPTALPLPERPVLLHLPHHDTPVTFGFHDGQVWRDLDAMEFLETVTHWSPLPPPPTAPTPSPHTSTFSQK